jgi:ATP-dependent DNA helicase RecG
MAWEPHPKAKYCSILYDMPIDWLSPELLDRLLEAGTELPWCEFKQNNVDPVKVGDTLAALSNGAALSHQSFGYLVYGVADDLRVTGTTVRLESERYGAEPLMEWLTRLVQPRTILDVAESPYRGARVVVVRIAAATVQPRAFQDRERIRVGSQNRSLRDYPDHSKRLWERLAAQPFEARVLSGPHSESEIAELLDLDAYQRLRALAGHSAPVVQSALIQDGALTREDDGRLNVTALGALLLARQLTRFPTVERRSVRIVRYPGVGRTGLGLSERHSSRGYAAGFEGLLAYVLQRVPSVDHIVGGVRRSVAVYPGIALREFIANALIHQDLAMTGTGPLIEIFDDRLEISNPGVPLQAPDRLMDLPPQSRNEALATTMRRLGLCEERGSGIDRAVEAIESSQLPAPEITVQGQHTKVIVLGPRPVARMTHDDRVRACYQHASLLWVSRVPMTNSTLRKRLGIPDRDYSAASRIIADAVGEQLVRPYDPENASRKHAKYVPFWAP